MPYTKQDVQVINTNIIYQGFINLELVELKFKMYNGSWSSVVKREVAKKLGAVGVILFDPKADLLIFVEQFRIGTLSDKRGPWQIEVVAGIIEPYITVNDTVHKEVLEESGAKILALEKITEYWVSPGCTNEYFHLFCAAVDSRDIPEFSGLADENEDICLKKISPEMAFNEIYSGNMNNAATIICLQWMKDNYIRLKNNWMKLL